MKLGIAPDVEGGGFTPGAPWLGLARDAKHRTVCDQDTDPRSVLNFCRALLRLRHATAALHQGSFRVIEAHPDVLAYLRQSGGEAVMVTLNMSDRIVPAALTDDAGRGWQVVLSSTGRRPGPVERAGLELGPLEAVVFQRNPLA